MSKSPHRLFGLAILSAGVLLALALFFRPDTAPQKDSPTPSATLPPQPIPPATTTSAGLVLISEQEGLQVYAQPSDRRAALDAGDTILAERADLCERLQVECPRPVTLEIYPDQTAFDRWVMNPEYRGFLAISGQGRIQMVSPNAPLDPPLLAYPDRVGIALHEYLHLILDQIEPDLPAWIDEGTTIVLGPHAIYDRVCEQAFPAGSIPALSELIENYSAVQAADLYAYTLVRFLVERDGDAALNDLLRSSAQRSALFSDPSLEPAWLAYLATTCPPAPGDD